MKTRLSPAPDRRSLLLAGGAAMLLAGCSGMIGPGPAPQLYVLRPKLGPLSDAPKADWQLAVALPSAPLGLDSARIALQRSPETMDYYANAAWPDRATVLVQQALLEGFQKSGRIGAVARDSEGLRADYLLQTDLRAFDARYAAPDGAPTIVVDIFARLMRTQGRRIVRSFDVRKTADAAANSVPAAVAAFDSALGEAIEEIVARVLAAPAPSEKT